MSKRDIVIATKNNSHGEDNISCRLPMAYSFSIESIVLAYIASLLGQKGYDIDQTSYKKLRE